MPLPLAALAAIPSIFQGVQGITQMAKGKRGMDALERPTYEIPTAARQSLALSKAAFGDSRMPGENRQLDRIGLSYSNYLRGARDTGNGLAGLAMAQANTNNAYGDLATQSAAHQDRDRQGLMSNLSNYAQYQDQAWQMNKFSPYKDQYNEYREMIGAGQQNTYGALNGLSSIGMQYLAGQPKPIDASQVANANASADVSMGQDQFLRAAARLAQGAAKQGMKTAQAAYPGMTAAQLMNAYKGMHRPF
jgi:hypothetical protein